MLPHGENVDMRMPDWKAMGRMTEGEYRANLNGLGIFFGAVLGFVMAGTEPLAPRDFALTLFMFAAAVICIVYVSSSRQRLLYAAITAVYIALLPAILHELLGKGAEIPRNLRPTLAVWLAITLFVEFLPRDPTPAGEG